MVFTGVVSPVLLSGLSSEGIDQSGTGAGTSLGDGESREGGGRVGQNVPPKKAEPGGL